MHPTGLTSWNRRIPLRRLCGLLIAAFPIVGGAAGLGEIALQSRIGEPLRAEIPLAGTFGNEAWRTACFSLVPLPGSDLPHQTQARLALSQRSNGTWLTIRGNRAVNDPLFTLSVQVACGVDLRRDYVLMPSPPLSQAETAAGESPTSPVPRLETRPLRPLQGSPAMARNFREWTTQPGDTLDSIAAEQSRGDEVEYDRLLSAMGRANPQLSFGEPLVPGTVVRIPAPRTTETSVTPPPRPARQRTPRPSASAGVATAPRAPAATPASTSTTPSPVQAAAIPAGDRLVVGKAEGGLSDKNIDAINQLNAMEDRLLRLETTLHLLNREVDKLNTALELATEALSAQQKLQMAQSIEVSPVPPAPPPPRNRHGWLELLLSALLGGTATAGLAHFIARRREPARPAPLYVAPAAPAQAPEPASASSHTSGRRAVDVPLGDNARSTPPPDIDIHFNDEAAALKLAEMMLAFGRTRGAAESLAAHIEEVSPEDIVPWRMLLDLYHRSGQHQEYGELAKRMRQKFNVNIPPWKAAAVGTLPLRTIEDYPHVVREITAHWGSARCMQYLDGLMHEIRKGGRFGFPLEVLEDIALLARVLESGHGIARAH